MYRIFLVIISLVLSAVSLTAQGQQAAQPYRLTLNDVVELAKMQSPMAIQARHQFRAAYFSFISYKANFLPKLTLTTNPTSWDKSIRTIPSFNDKGELVYKETKGNTLTSEAWLALSQNIGLTGGSIALRSDFTRTQNFLQTNSKEATSYTTNPVRLTLTQPLNGYNQLRWEKKIEPLAYEEARQRYIVELENVSSNAVDMFFNLAEAQVNLNIAGTNLNSSEELYRITQGRYNVGSVGEDDLLRVELRHMQATSKLNSAKVQIESAQNRLRSFLGFRDNVNIELLIDTDIPGFKVEYEKALDLALTRNPNILAYQQQLLESERLVALAKSQTGITIQLDATFGTNKTGYAFKDAYSTPYGDREGVSLQIKVPILDWNQTRNRYRQRQSELEVRQAQVQQSETTFRQNVFLQVMSFNLQEDQVRIAAKSDTIAQRSYEITYQRYMSSKSTITDLNLADTAKDEAKVGYIEALNRYWTLYYSVRQYTLFDFQNNKPLEEDLDSIIEN